jgi:hypothetical protein
MAKRGIFISTFTTLLLFAGGDIAPVEPAADIPNTSGTGYNPMAIGVSAGTIGVDLEYSYLVAPEYNLAVRVAAGGLSYNGTYDDTDVTYDTDDKLFNIGATLEYHPFANGFYIGGGVFYHDNEFEMTAKPTGGTYEFNGNTYDATLAGHD